MTADQMRRLRGHYHALRGQQRVLEGLAGQAHTTIGAAGIQPLAMQLTELEREFPGFAPLLQLGALRIPTGGTELYYDLAGVQAHLAVAIGRLTVEVESSQETPITEHREFAFTRDDQLRAILQRDYREIQRSFVAECWKSVIILSGGAHEAVLLDLALDNEAAAKGSLRAPKKPDVRRWDLSELIDVCIDAKLVSPYVSSVSDATREYRNLVHPGNELRTELRFGAEEARIALTVLEMIHRDLSR